MSRRSRAASTSTENETMTGNLNLKGTRAAKRPKADGGKMGSAEEKELIWFSFCTSTSYLKNIDFFYLT